MLVIVMKEVIMTYGVTRHMLDGGKTWKNWAWRKITLYWESEEAPTRFAI